MSKEASLSPTILVVFGISGDLSHRFLLPALAQICSASNLTGKLSILGVSRQNKNLEEVLGPHLQSLRTQTELYKMNLSEAEDYRQLKEKLAGLGKDFPQPPQIIFYFAVPPAAVLPIIRHLGKAGLNGDHTKLLLEKPFGTDWNSAKELIDQIDKHYSEDQVYRIDHYLAKQMAQNITVFLGSNAIFRNVWNSGFIEEIEIVAAEAIGIEGRIGFYEGTGALRDFMQSHLLQLAALVLMEPCSDIFDFEEIPRRRLAALEALQPIPADKFPGRVYRAQYEGYTKEVNNPATTTETFVSLTLESSNFRWEGVPIHLVTGKNLDQKLTEIRVQFKKTSASASNLLILRVQPREGIEIDLWVKEPGYERKLQKLKLSFAYEQHFGRLPDAYEMVIVDSMRSNHSLFASSAEVLASWRILQPVLDSWSMSSDDLKFYKPGSTIDQVMGSV
ncbi:glucose-6-phosphate dehydrogenase (NADP(+)) [Candidatus Saccharibacteria bacterium]|nr:glucose-6-phosphate dehydrogenase (NADP(+)) [Candidatus Saccharibacteria bacterium]